MTSRGFSGIPATKSEYESSKQLMIGAQCEQGGEVNLNASSHPASST